MRKHRSQPQVSVCLSTYPFVFQYFVILVRFLHARSFVFITLQTPFGKEGVPLAVWCGLGTDSGMNPDLGVSFSNSALKQTAAGFPAEES
jgi:hypothetical protein